MTPAERARAYRQRKAEAAGRTVGKVGRPPADHGASRYVGGCRCDICRAAHAARIALYRSALSREGA